VIFYNKIKYQFQMNGITINIDKSMNINHNMLMIPYMVKYQNIDKNTNQNNNLIVGQLLLY